MALSHAILLLAGFTLAHAIWNVSDLEDTGDPDALIPFVIVQHQENRSIHRFPRLGADSIRAFAAKNFETDSSVDGWAFARLDSVTGDDGRIAYAVCVEFWSRDTKHPVTLIQFFTLASKHQHFRLIDEPYVAIDGTLLDSASADPLVMQVEEGIHQHARADSLWPTWQR